MIECVILLALLSLLIATDPMPGESEPRCQPVPPKSGFRYKIQKM